MVKVKFSFRLSDKQTLQINEMRKQLEEDHNKQRENMEKTTKDMNLQLVKYSKISSINNLYIFNKKP